MRLVGLGGGIGSGKSSASRLLEARGAAIIDADVIAREVVEPGTSGLRAITVRFGDGVIRADGTLDRAALAAIVFADKAALADLNAITHPAIEAEMIQRVALHAGTSDVVVYDAALSFATEPFVMVGRIVVDIDPGVAVARLVELRGFSVDDARARIGAQISRSERLAAADLVIDNSGSMIDLANEVARAWAWIESLPDTSDRALG